MDNDKLHKLESQLQKTIDLNLKELEILNREKLD